MSFLRIIRFGGIGFGFKALLDSINILGTKILYRLKFFKGSVQRAPIQLLQIRKDEILIDVKNDKTFIQNLQSNQKFSLRNHTSDIAVYLEIYESGEYDLLLRYISEMRIEINTILDIGSNIGMSILFFQNEFPKSKIIALEPDKSNYEQLQENIELNALEQVIPINAGIWVSDAKLSIDADFRGGNHWSLAVVEDINGAIQGVTIDSLIEDQKLDTIDLLKIDIEGAEEILFRYPEKCNYLERVQIACIEIHEEVQSFSTVANTLVAYGFKLDFKNDVLIGYKD
ncbi:MAG: hypothetical protein Tsb0034_08790 [Ekhidna sp.]